MANEQQLEHYWSIPAEQLFQMLNSSADGLSAAEAEQRLTQYGANRIMARRPVTPVGIFLNQFKSPIILILLGATIISAFLGDWLDAAIILLIVLGSAMLSFYQ